MSTCFALVTAEHNNTPTCNCMHNPVECMVFQRPSFLCCLHKVVATSFLNIMLLPIAYVSLQVRSAYVIDINRIIHTVVIISVDLKTGSMLRVCYVGATWFHFL